MANVFSTKIDFRNRINNGVNPGTLTALMEYKICTIVFRLLYGNERIGSEATSR